MRGVRLVYIDLLRGFAALAVVLGHTRAIMNTPWGQSEHTMLGAIWVLLSSQHHIAVVIFFVLSGYMVGGAVLSQIVAGKWSWPLYGVTRMTRLYLVLIPALLITLGFDLAGQYLVPAADVYAGHGDNGMALLKDPLQGHTLATFIGNAAFLQDIYYPVFGTNGSLWSLSYEFWYYLLFPCLCLAIIPRPKGGIWSRLIHLLLLSGMAWLIGTKGLWLILPWLAGALVAYGLDQSKSHETKLWWRWAAWAFLVIAVPLPSVLKATASGLTVIPVIIGTCMVLWSEARADQDASPMLRLAAEQLSDISFTLYATHLPLLVFVHAVVLGNSRMPYTPVGIASACGLAFIALLAARGWWWLFERKTSACRQRLTAMLKLKPLR
jgi:peptidoglycan/LPS O-acetylase OafA/YrhL